ncbi:MAG: hypothetical protein KDB61_09420 [Planctomycetes bacterium]|nr:hypothetical protein [Planctomycetota bacterium]
MKRIPFALASILSIGFIVACGRADHEAGKEVQPQEPPPVKSMTNEEDHSHDEKSLGSFEIEDGEVTLAQSHGGIAPGKEGHLIVKLPYTDQGATTVRAWIGGEDRTLSYVGLGEYAASHDDYDIHATAPDPLPENTLWWIEIEKPDGSKRVGSIQPLFE